MLRFLRLLARRDIPTKVEVQCVGIEPAASSQQPCYLVAAAKSSERGRRPTALSEALPSVSSVSPAECRNSNFKQATTASFQILDYSPPLIYIFPPYNLCTRNSIVKYAKNHSLPASGMIGPYTGIYRLTY